ncbi:MAG: protein kinase [Kofleriaceae bacterium]
MAAHDLNFAMATCNNCRHQYPDTALFCPSCGTAKVRTDGDLLLGKVLGERFLVQERVGQGTSGTIYRAEHVTLRRKVAIKVLHAELARDDLAVERFRREATMVAEVDNEHIVEIHDFGRAPDGRLYLAMEMLEGETLDELLRREGKLSVERTADTLIQVGEGLMEAHAVGYVHRDLRPRNIYLAVRRGKANFVKLLDFGLSKLVESDSHAASTSLGMTFGDPRYMSPEQARGDRIDRRADIYQLGCIAYEMLTGAPPFVSERVFDVLSRHVTEAPAPLPSRRPDVPLWMEAAVARMLAKSPEDRFATTSRLVAALRLGLERGEIMQDEVARQTETIPPASVSRVMQRMGVQEPAPVTQGAAPPPVAPSVPSMTISTSIVPPPAATPVSRPPMAAVPAPTAVPVSRPPMAGVPAPAPAAVSQPVPAPAPAAMEGPPAMPRRGTGTPRVGVPIVSGPSATPASTPSRASEPRLARSVEPSAPKLPAPEEPSAEESGSNVASARAEPVEPGVSQVWFEDEDAAHSRSHGHRDDSLSSTDVLLGHATRRRRLRMALIGAALLAIAGISFAVIGGDSSKEQPVVAEEATPPPPASAPALEPAAVAPPAVAATEPAATEPAAIQPAPTKATPTKTTPTKTTTAKPREAAPRAARPAPSGFAIGEPNPTGEDPLLRRPRAPEKPVVEPVSKPDPAPGAGVSGGDTTLDPYGASDAEVAQHVKQAEDLATTGQKALRSGDLAGAAANFKKAVELDAKNLLAVAGLGEIALRQGLFGDAVAHLRKGAQLAPRSARIQTLLGEALLNSGDANAAAEAFKKALQLNPDNARARDGYNDAIARAGGAEEPEEP